MKTEIKFEKLQLTPTSWSEFPDVDEVRPIDETDYAILNEIKDVLLKHNAINRFGVNLIHRHFELQKDEIIFETTDVEKRSQRIEVCPSSIIVDNKRVLETQWVFNGGSAVVCVGYCDYNQGHKHYHQAK